MEDTAEELVETSNIGLVEHLHHCRILPNFGVAQLQLGNGGGEVVAETAMLVPMDAEVDVEAVRRGLGRIAVIGVQAAEYEARFGVVGGVGDAEVRDEEGPVVGVVLELLEDCFEAAMLGPQPDPEDVARRDPLVEAVAVVRQPVPGPEEGLIAPWSRKASAIV